LKNNSLIESFLNYQLWLTLALTKIRVRFIRTALGPIWEILGTSIFLIFISFIWSKLWGETFFDFFCYLYSGFIIWKAISSIIGDGTYLFSDTYSNYFENISINPFIFCMSHTAKNFIVLLMNFPILIIILIINDSFYLISVLWMLIYFILFFITGVSTSFILATFCLKFRDLQFSIIVLLQLIFFMTPVIWKIDQLSGNAQRFIIEPNLLYHYIELFRTIALSGEINMKSLIIVSITTLLLTITSLIIYKKFNKKLIFWIA
jgi:lipopolysaccharide transport system permease protein